MAGVWNLMEKEFLAICAFLERDASRIHKGFLLIKKEDLEALLNKNKYETAENKLRYWKALRWIDTEEKRLTKRVYEGRTKKYIPYVVIYRQVYETMKRLTGGETG